jgi:hypothetical protein
MKKSGLISANSFKYEVQDTTSYWNSPTPSNRYFIIWE